jgi:hypothetical protein
MTIAPEHLSMALEWIDDLEVLSDSGKRLIRELSKELSFITTGLILIFCLSALLKFPRKSWRQR